MPATTHKQRTLINQGLAIRYEAGDKIELGDLPEGSLFIVSWYDAWNDKRRYALIFSYRKNKNDTVCTFYDPSGEPECDLRYPNKEKVVLLVPVSDNLQGE